MRKLLSLLTALLFVGSMWAGDVSGTINFGNASGSTNVNAASVNGDDSQGNQWTITTEGTTSFTPNAAYAQIGSSKKPATSITFTTTLAAEKTIKAFSAKFGGFSGTEGTVTLKVGSTSVGTGSLNAATDVIVDATNTTTSGTVLTVTVTGISKGVKAYYISYTYDDGGDPDPVLQSIAISGIPTTTIYEENNLFDVTGLVVTGTYDVGEPAVISEGITWKVRTNAGSDDAVALENYHLTVGQTSLQVQASVDEIASAWFDVTGLTVNEHVVTPGTYDIVPNNEFWGTNYNGTDAAAITTVEGTQDDITVSMTKSGNNGYINNSQTRVYSDYTMTFSAPTGFVLTAIVFTADGSSWAGTHTASAGTMTDNKHWAGTANSVTITFGGTCRIINMAVTYIEIPSVANPSISGETPFLNSSTITIECETDGATIYYTLDGEDPDNTATEYTAPFAITETTTIKAIAYKDAAHSDILSMTFTEATAITVAEALELADKTNNVFVAGIVSGIITAYTSENGYASYYISDDGLTTSQLQCYKGIGEGIDVLAVGDKVVVKGDYTTSYGKELKANNTLKSRTALSSVAIDDSEAAKAYEAGDEFELSNVKATATFGDASTLDVTNWATWTPASAPTVTEDGNVNVTASWCGKTGEKSIAVTVNTHAVTFDATPANGTLNIYEDDLETLISSGDAFAKGTELYVDAKPASGYKLDAVKVIKTGVEPEVDVTDAVYDEGLLTIPTYAITVSASFVEDKGTALNNTEVEGKAVKLLRNGILLIEKNGHTYNAQGLLIK